MQSYFELSTHPIKLYGVFLMVCLWTMFIILVWSLANFLVFFNLTINFQIKLDKL